MRNQHMFQIDLKNRKKFIYLYIFFTFNFLLDTQAKQIVHVTPLIVNEIIYKVMVKDCK